MDNTETAGLVREAARLLRDEGFCKGISHGPDGARCIGGALGDAASGNKGAAVQFYGYGGFDTVVSVLQGVIEEQYPEQFPSSNRYAYYMAFNDHPDTTVADVLAVLEKTASRLEERA